MSFLKRLYVDSRDQGFTVAFQAAEIGAGLRLSSRFSRTSSSRAIRPFLKMVEAQVLMLWLGMYVSATELSLVVCEKAAVDSGNVEAVLSLHGSVL